jgi:hypothetical protein
MLLAVTVLDALAMVLASSGALVYGQVLVDWSPESTERRQITLEARAEAASLATRFALWLFLAATVVLVVAISQVLPSLVPGAMCGTGVLEAMGGEGERALALRGLAVAVFWAWRTLDGLNRSSPTAPDVPLCARWHLLGMPLLALATLATFRGSARLDPHRAVSCCQMVYDNFRSVQQASTLNGVAGEVWLAAFALATAGLVAVSLWIGLRGEQGLVHLLLIALVAAWLPLASVSLVRVLSAYTYEVLHHQCPWCLFLPEHGMVGYPLWGALSLVGLGAIEDLASARFARSRPDIVPHALRRQRWAIGAVLLGVSVFALMAVGPAILWRLQHGVWMTGAG